MGGRGMGSVKTPRDEYVARAVVSFNPDAKARPYSIAEAQDVGGTAEWGTDSRQRPKTFASLEAAEDYIRRSASGPVQIDHVSRGGSYPDRDQMRAAADRAGPEARATLEGIWDRRAQEDRSFRDKSSLLVSAENRARSAFRDESQSRSDRLHAAGQIAGYGPILDHTYSPRVLAEVRQSLGPLSESDLRDFQRGRTSGIRYRQTIDNVVCKQGKENASD